MNAVIVMSKNMIIDVIKCEQDVMQILYDVIRVPRVMTYTFVVMSLIERHIDTHVCAICDDTDTVAVMSNMAGEMTGIIVVLS